MARVANRVANRVASAAHFEPVAWWYAREEIGRGLREYYGPAGDLPPRLQLIVKRLDKPRIYRRGSGRELPLPFRILKSSGKRSAAAAYRPPEGALTRAKLSRRRLPTD